MGTRSPGTFPRGTRPSRVLRRLAPLIAWLPACTLPPHHPTDVHAAAATPPAWTTVAGMAVGDGGGDGGATPAEEVFGFWLLGQSSWQGTLYTVALDGLVHEAETISAHHGLWTEPVGTLHWVEGCAEEVGCRIHKTCPLAGRLREIPPAPASPCDAFVFDLTVRCSDGEERSVRASFDGACEGGSEPSAFVYVNGEPGTDGRLPGWDNVGAARYRLCPSSEACRAGIARAPAGGEDSFSFGDGPGTSGLSESTRSSPRSLSRSLPVLTISAAN